MPLYMCRYVRPGIASAKIVTVPARRVVWYRGLVAQTQLRHTMTVGGQMSRSRIALLGGPAFFVLWSVGATFLWSATGGESQAERSEFPEVLLSNESGAYAGATLLMLAGASILWFAAGLRDRIRSEHGIGLVSTLGTAGVAMLLILQAGLAIEAVAIAEETPDTSWTVYQLSNALGYESFMTPLLGAVTLTGLLATTDRTAMRRWFWWLTVVFAAVLIVGGILEGLGVTPDGRFAIFFGLWAFIAGFTLSVDPAAEETPSP